MANLSNINGKFVIEQTTGYVGVGTTDPNFLIEAAGTNSEIALNSTSGSIYRVRSTSSDAFIITKNGVGDRLVIDGAGNATFGGEVSLKSRLNLQRLSGGATTLIQFKNENGVDRAHIDFGGTDEELSFFAGAGTVENMRIDSSGNVGIGETNPENDNRLHIKYSDANVTPLSSSPLVVERNDVCLIQTLTSNASDAGILFGDGDDNDIGGLFYLHGSDAMTFRTNTSERMRIDSSGQVQVRNGAGGGAELLLYNTDGSLTDQQIIGTLGFYKSDGSGSGAGISSSIIVRSDSPNGGNSSMSFNTDGGAGQQNVERMRITSSGDVQLVGNKYLYANPSAGSTIIGAGFQLDAVNNIMKLWTNNVERMRIDSSGNATFSGHIAVEDGNNFYGANAIAASSEDGNYVASFGKSTSGSAKFAGNITVGSGNSAFAGNVLVEDNLYLTDAGTVRGKIQLNSSDRDDLDIKAVSLGSNMKFFTVDTERMRIDSSGNLSLATATSLDFNVADFAQIKFRESGAITIDSDNDQSSRNFAIKDGDGTNLLTVFDTGNVAIGITFATAKLQIHNTNAGAAAVAAYLVNASTSLNTETRLAFAAHTNDDIATGRYSYISTINTSGSNGQAMTFATNESGASAVERMRIDSSGKSTFYSNEIEVYASSSSASLILNSGDATKDEWTIVSTDLAGDAYLRFVDTTTATTVMSLRDNGNVGIGTDSPSFPLEVDGGSGDGIKIKAGNSLNDDSFLVANNADSTLFLVDGGGNVGIGTTTPLHDLQIGTAATNGSYSMMIEGNFANTALSSNPRLNLIDTNFGITAGKYGSGGTDDAIGIFAFQGAGRGILFAHTTAGSGTALQGMRHDMFVDGGTGNVGIGTTSPSGPFHVKVGTSTPLIVASSSYCNNVGIRTTTPTASLQVKGNVSYSYNNYTNVANTWINVINFSGYPAGLYQISIIKKTDASTYITAIVKWSATAGTVINTIASNQLGITFSGTQLQAISGIATGTLMSANLQCLVTNEDFCS